jgi:hypothetical protein
VVAHAFNSNTWEAEAGGFLSSGQAWSSEFQDSQGYTENPCGGGGSTGEGGDYFIIGWGR